MCGQCGSEDEEWYDARSDSCGQYQPINDIQHSSTSQLPVVNSTPRHEASNIDLVPNPQRDTPKDWNHKEDSLDEASWQNGPVESGSATRSYHEELALWEQSQRDQVIRYPGPTRRQGRSNHPTNLVMGSAVRVRSRSPPRWGQSPPPRNNPAMEHPPTGENRRKNGSFCEVCRKRVHKLRRHLACQHLPWFVIPNQACWNCHRAFDRESTCIDHLKEHCAEGGFTNDHIGIYCRLMFNLLMEIAGVLCGYRNLWSLLEKVGPRVRKIAQFATQRTVAQVLTDEFALAAGLPREDGKVISWLLHWRVLAH